MARKTYTREFKLQALRMLSDQGLSVAEVARRPGGGDGLVLLPGVGIDLPDDVVEDEVPLVGGVLVAGETHRAALVAMEDLGNRRHGPAPEGRRAWGWGVLSYPRRPAERANAARTARPDRAGVGLDRETGQ
jgi:hypothetical protein